MYHHLRGRVIELNPTSLVIEAGGVGYDVRIPLSTYDSLKGKQDVVVLTHLHVREDDLKLFGFASSPERELFRLLVAVSGVGPSTALAALCAFSPLELAQAIVSGDHKLIQRIKGVGKKLAERLVIELRDRVGKLFPTLRATGDAAAVPSSCRPGLEPTRSLAAVDAIGVLVSLGFDRKSAEERVDATVRRLQAGAPGGAAEGRLEVERLIKEALRAG